VPEVAAERGIRPERELHERRRGLEPRMTAGYGNLGKLDERDPDAPKHSWGKWPKIDPATVAPLRDDKPDMYNHMPTRFVSKAEAGGRGGKHFGPGKAGAPGP